MTLHDLQVIVDYFELYHKPLDDCMWINRTTYRWLKSQFTVKSLTEDMHVSMAGISCWQDDTVPDNTIETGTYEHRDGNITKVVRRTFNL